MKGDKLLSIKGLRVEFPTQDGPLVAVNDVDLDVTRGEVLGIVGESGSGKTVLGLSSMGLIDRPGRVAAGQVCLTVRTLQTIQSPDGEIFVATGLP